MTSGSVDLGSTFGSGGGGGVSSLNGLTGAVTLIPGTGIVITPGSGTITISSTTSGGTVTSVALAAPSSILSVSGSPVTTLGTLTLSLATQLANTVWAGPSSGGAATPTFRSLVSSDLPAGTGTVTSVALTTPGVLYSVSGSPITTSGTLALNLISQSANTFLAAPNGSAGNPSFRLIVPADVPTLNQNTTGTAGNITAASNMTLTSLPNLLLATSQLTGDIILTSQVTGILPIANGGTNASTVINAFNNLSPLTTAGDLLYENGTPAAARLPIGASGQVLTVIGGFPSWQTVTGTGTVTTVSVVSANGFAGTVSNPTTTAAINLSTTITGILQGNGTAISAATTTGSGAIVLATSPTLVTPNLGTPSTLVLTNATGLPFAQVTGFTSGSVIFAGPSGALDQDNANFFWNDITYNLGLGTIPATTISLDIVNVTGASKAVQTTSYGVGSTIPFRGRFARGSLGTPTAAQSGDTLSTLSGRGYGTSQFATASTGAINIVAGETFTNTSNATYLQFEVTPTGSVILTEAMRIAPTGNLLIGTTTDSGTQKLQVNGNSNVGTVTAGIWNGTATHGSDFITSGTTYTTPSTITTATVFKFTLIGGGAGGSSSNSASTHSSCGGAGGGLILYTTGLSPSTGYTIAIGAAGAGGAAAAVGGNGGNTTLTIGATTYTASGGSGAATVAGAGGAGGTATNGTINITGQSGGPGMAIFTSGGMSGGTAPFGFGLGGAGNAASVAGNGQNATGYGGGGGGSSSNGSPTGGNGTQGMILVEWDN